MYNRFSRLMLAFEGLKDFAELIMGAKDGGGLKNLVAKKGPTEVANKFIDAAAKVLKQYFDKDIEQGTIDVFANNIKQIIELAGCFYLYNIRRIYKTCKCYWLCNITAQFNVRTGLCNSVHKTIPTTH